MNRVLIVGLMALSLVACNKGGAIGAQGGAENLKKAEAYLQKNATAEGVKTTPSGLQYKVLSEGPAGGVHPKMGDEVKVQYEGKLIDGTVFDSSYNEGTPAAFVVGQVVPGWNEALQLMKPGDTYELYLPPKLGYGENGAGPIPPNSALVFKVELLDVFQH